MKEDNSSPKYIKADNYLSRAGVYLVF